MSDDNKPFGILVGVMGGTDGQPLVGLSFGGTVVAAMSIDHAGLVFEQLGLLLENFGYFDDEHDCETCANKDDCEDSTCKTKH